MRPASILLFGRLYAIAIFAALVANILELFSAKGGGIAYDLLPRLVAVTLINVALWYFVTRRASIIAKWIFVLLIVLATAGVGVSLYYHLLPPGIRGMLATITIGLEIVCVVLLFRPDARAWFHKEPAA